ncbi:acetoacetate decarboxylase [halophilic archaeon]|nr:acetoacetate decarboxylase [halophilic archaeon]
MTDPVGGTTAEPFTLSTGETVDLPLSTDAAMTGAAFGANYGGVRELLPEGLVPIRTAPGRAAVTFLCVEYRRIGAGEIAPYDEFGVLLPAVRGSTGTVPLASALRGGAGGYVWYLPVTTEPGRALGVDVWGYPKAVGDVTFDDDGTRRRTTVTVDGKRLLTVEIDRPPTFGARLSASSFTVKDGTLLRAPLEFVGDVGGWPFSRRASYALGDHPRAERLRRLDLGSRALVRFAADGEFTIRPGRPVDEP